MGVTIRDVARAAGVSTATVSRALRGLPHVDPQTRDTVIRVAGELDYVASANASRLASGRQGTVAVITPFVARWFFATLLSGVSEVLQAHDVDLLVHQTSDPTATSGLPPARRLRGRVDALIVVALPTDAVSPLLDLGIPASLVGATAPGVPSVAIDDVEAGAIATAHLISLGHERIGLISGDDPAPDSTPGRRRAEGYRRAMAEAGLAVDDRLRVDGAFTVEGGEAAMSALLARPDRPTAVFALSDEMAFGAIRSLHRHGLRPGSDIGLIGVDGHDLAELLDLSTVAQPVAEMGRAAAEQVLARLRRPDGDPGRQAGRLRRPDGDPGSGASSERPAAPSWQAPTHLVVRGSTVPLERTVGMA